MAKEGVVITSDEPEPTKQVSGKKGGLKTMPFIIANESFEKVVGYGIAVNIILYLIEEYHMTGARAASVVFLWNAASNFMPTLGAILSDSYFGRFRAIAFGSVFCLLGTTMLWFTALFRQARPAPCDQTTGSCEPPTSGQLAVLFSSFILLSIGAGGIRPCSVAFGADQIYDPRNPKNDQYLQSYFNWYYASVGVSLLISTTLIIYIQDSAGWAIGFGVPLGLISLATILFFLGNSFYVKVKADKSLLTAFAQVAVASYRNRQLVLPLENPDGSYCYHHHKDSKVISPSERLRFLNKACLIRDQEKDLDYNGRAIDPWKLCTAQQVEELKALIKLLPIWSTGILISVSFYQSFPVLQATAMDRRFISGFKIPAGSYGVFAVLALIAWVMAYDRAVVPLMVRLTRRPDGLSLKQRMGIGLALSNLSMVVSALVESRRLATTNRGGPGRGPLLSAMWLIPQFCLGGLAEALYIIGQIGFFYSQLPKSMASIGVGLATLNIAIGNMVASLIVRVVDGLTKRGGNTSWLPSNANNGHYDYYYWVLSGMSLVNLLYYLACSWAYGSCNDDTVRDEDHVEEGEINDA